MFGSSTKKIILITSILILFSFVVLGGLFFMIKRGAENISAYEIEQHQINAQFENDRSLKVFLENSGDDINRLSSRIVSKEGTVAFIELIEKLARDNDLSIEVESVKLSEVPTHKDTFEILNLSIATTGSWNGTYRFLSLLEYLPYKVLITTVGMTSEKVDDGKSVQTTWNGAFSIGVIKYKEQ